MSSAAIGVHAHVASLGEWLQKFAQQHNTLHGTCMERAQIQQAFSRQHRVLTCVVTQCTDLGPCARGGRRALLALLLEGGGANVAGQEHNQG